MHAGPGLRALAGVLAAIAGLAIAPAPAAAACADLADNVTLDVGLGTDGWCAIGAAIGSDGEITFNLAEAGRWQIEVEALPGQIGTVTFLSGAATLWERPLAGTGALVTAPLLLPPGDYGIRISASDTLIYRVRLTPISTPPPTEGPAAAGAFSATLVAAGELTVPWTVPPTPAGTVWSISAQAPPGSYLMLLLRDANGTVAWTNVGDGLGTFSLADLALAPGDYTISVSGPPEGAPIVLSLADDFRPSGYAAEPDDLPGAAHPIAIGVAATGRLTTGGTDIDLFVLDVAPGTPVRIYDVSIAAIGGPARLSLLDENQTVLFERSGPGQVRLAAVALGPGRHFFRVAAGVSSEVRYTVLVEDTGTIAAGAEIEPNDVAARATPLQASGPVRGTFAGEDYDYIDLGFAGEMRLWDVEAVGTGLERLTIYDGADQVIATTAPSAAGAAALLSRILLPPGRTIVRVDGHDDAWLLRATPLGPPVLGEEIEPNDEQSRALQLSAGSRQIGWLDRPGDIDLYTFHLAAPHRVRLTLTGPADLPLTASIAWGEASNRITDFTTIGGSGEPQRLVWEGLLQPGDFFVDIRTFAGTSRDPYALTLDTPAFADRPVDLEPNDAPWQAAPLPPGGCAEGVLLGNDVDWFAIDPAIGTGPVVLRAEALDSWVRVLVARGDPAAPETLAEAYLYAAGETLTVDLPDGRDLFLRIDGNPGRYAIALGAAVSLPQTPVAAALVFDAATVAAYAGEGQQVTGTLVVLNKSDAARVLDTVTWTGDERWRLDGVPHEIRLAPGESISLPVTLVLPSDVPDGARVGVEVALAERSAAPAIARAEVEPAVGVPTVGQYPFAALPDDMIGGLNVAWVALGGAIDDPAQVGLIDNVVDVAGVTLTGPAVVRLSGGGPVPVAGVVLEPVPGGAPSQRLAGFAIEVSADGSTFERVFEGRLSARAEAQAFSFGVIRTAVAVRLVPLSVQSGDPNQQPLLAEFRVVAEPGFILDPAGFDIALPALGGHVVRQAGIPDFVLTGETAMWPSSYAIPLPVERPTPPNWVLGFLDDRAAPVAGIVWYPRSDIAAGEQITTVEVAASIAGPFGPFVSLGTFAVDPGTATALPFEGPRWVRYLRFSAVAPAEGRVYLPDRIEVREAPGPSIIGEWGTFSTTGPYEAGRDAPAPAAPPAPVSTDRVAPTPLALGSQAIGEVRRGAVEHWYAVDIPDGTLRLRADFAAALAPEVALALVGPDGTEIPLEADPATPGSLWASVEPGQWLLRVTQPKASVVVAWDTSFSVAAFYPSIARLVRQLGNNLDPAQEEMNLLPFRGDDSRFLLDTWSGDPGAIYAALHAYPLRDASSDAESALLFAARELSQRVGSRAVVIITDAAYSGVYKNEALWRSLEVGGVRVFALHLPVDYDPARVRAQQNLMTDWAAAAGGHVSRYASLGDSEAAFRRVNAWLRQPANYAFTLVADTTPPEPGLLSVTLAAPEPGAAPSVAPPMSMAIVLDASGSMLQRLGDQRRIDIAKGVLERLGAEILPDGIPVALRVFGNDRPDSCEQHLLLPLAPLDRNAFVAAVAGVQSINLARTPIAAALRAAASDLAAASGSRVIVLVTDGEETCGGDPLAEIEALRAAGFDVRLNIVGFAIGDDATRAMFETWATAGGGAYFDAANEAALGAAVEAATAIRFVVLSMQGDEAGAGLVGGQPVQLPPGRYQVRLDGGERRWDVTISPGQSLTLDLEAVR